MKMFLVFAILLLSPPLAFATPTLVQKANAHPGSSATCAVTLSGVAANDTLAFYAYSTANQTFTSIADSSGNTVSTADNWSSNVSPAISYGFFYVQAASAGTHTITITLASTGNIVCFLSEWSGLATTGVFDTAGATHFVATSSTVTSNSITPATNGELIIFAIGQSNSGNTYSSWNNSFAQQDLYNSTGPGGVWASEVQATAAAISGQVTSSGANNYAANIVAFKAAGSGTCTNAGITQAGAFVVPTAGSTVVRLKNGSFGTVDCATGPYKQKSGVFGVN